MLYKLSFFAVITLIAAVGMAQKNTPVVSEPVQQAVAPQSGGQGMKVYIDPVTGQFTTPPPQAAAAMNSLTIAPGQNVRVHTVVLPNGTTMLVTDPVMSEMRATVDSKGEMTIRCIPVEVKEQ